VLPSELLDVEHFYPPRDRTGMVIPHRFELPIWLRLFPGMLAFFENEVPEDFWAEQMEDETPTIVIACPCGEEPVLRFGLRAYSLAECGCRRVFMHDGRKVRAGRYDLDE
jgi:hypothetical protein